MASVPVTVYVDVLVGANAIALITPPVNIYVEAPAPFKVTLEPKQTSPFTGVDVADTIGLGFIVTMIGIDDGLVHPFTVTVAL